MAVPRCVSCSTEQLEPSAEDLQAGDYCPICFNPTCRKHLVIVRFRWKDTRQADSALICRTCKSTYQHRYWDSARRDWIS